MTKKNETIKLQANSVDHKVHTAHHPDVTDVDVGQRIASLLEDRKRGVTIDGSLVITHPRSNKIEVVNFGLVDKSSFSTIDTFSLKTTEDMYKLRAQLRTDFGLRTYCDGEYGGDPNQYTLTRGFDVFATEIAKIIVSSDK